MTEEMCDLLLLHVSGKKMAEKKDELQEKRSSYLLLGDDI